VITICWLHVLLVSSIAFFLVVCRNKDSSLKTPPIKGLGASKSSSAPSDDDLGDDDFDDFDPRGSAKSGNSLLAGYKFFL
jgi:hypothetical protein